jgi:hypothetical protein
VVSRHPDQRSAPSLTKPLDAYSIVACLNRQGVEYVLIGGLAAVLHGSPQVTFAADICPARDPENLEHLATALREMRARLRAADAPERLPFPCDAGFLAGVQMFNLVTDHGDLDLSFEPSGTGGYPDLIRDASSMTLKGYSVSVAALEDVIRSKEAAGRPKDQAALPLLRQLLEEIRTKG